MELVREIEAFPYTFRLSDHGRWERRVETPKNKYFWAFCSSTENALLNKLSAYVTVMKTAEKMLENPLK